MPTKTAAACGADTNLDAAIVLTRSEADFAFPDRNYADYDPCVVIAHRSQGEVIKAAARYIVKTRPGKLTEFIMETLNASAGRPSDKSLYQWDVVAPGDVRLVIWTR